jgi:hypothetical protein
MFSPALKKRVVGMGCLLAFQVIVFLSVVDPWHFGAGPDPRIRASNQWIRIRMVGMGCLLAFQVIYYPVLWIRGILVRIRIRGSVPMTDGSGSGWSAWAACSPSRKSSSFLLHSVVHPWHVFGTDPDPRIRASDHWIRIRVFGMGCLPAFQVIVFLLPSVVDPWHFATDPDPSIRTSDQLIRLRLLLFSSMTFKAPAKKLFF